MFSMSETDARFRDIYSSYGLTACERVYTPVPVPVWVLVSVLKAPKARAHTNRYFNKTYSIWNYNVPFDVHVFFVYRALG